MIYKKKIGTTEFCKVDDNLMVSASHDKTLKVWNTLNGNVVNVIDDNVGGSIISVISIRESNIMLSAGLIN